VTPAAWVYILRSDRTGRFYIGHTTDILRRLALHNARAVKATRHQAPWTLAYTEGHSDTTSARKREWELKKLKSRIILQRLIDSQAASLR
jgi:putative endonuclease